jgi:hypothetical protein
MRCRRARSPKLPTDERVDGHHERHLRRLNSVRRGSSRISPHITSKRQLIFAHTAAGVRKAESEHMVHWGRRCCGAPCSRIVRIRALVQCPVGSKLTSSGGIALQAARSWELKCQKVRIYVYHFYPYPNAQRTPRKQMKIERTGTRS